MFRKRPQFEQLATIDITKKRTVVISLNSQEEKVLIGQQIKTEDEDGAEINFFLKGALSVPVDQVHNLIMTLLDAEAKLKAKFNKKPLQDL